MSLQAVFELIRPYAIILDKQWHRLTPPHIFKARQKYRSWQEDKRERGKLAACCSVDCWGEGQLKDSSLIFYDV